MGWHLQPPHNSETSLIIDSSKLDGNLIGRRFLSNGMALLRSYEYQQSCPYKQLNGSAFDGQVHTMSSQCACNGSHYPNVNRSQCEPFGQPDWNQPRTSAILGRLLDPLQHLEAARAWPKVSVNLAVSDIPLSATSVTAEMSALGGVQHGPIKLFYDPGVGLWLSSNATTLPFAAECSVLIKVEMHSWKNGSQATVDFVADASFDFTGQERRPDSVLSSMAFTQAVSYT
jgi:hypothetical protein